MLFFWKEPDFEVFTPDLRVVRLNFDETWSCEANSTVSLFPGAHVCDVPVLRARKAVTKKITQYAREVASLTTAFTMDAATLKQHVGEMQCTVVVAA